MLKRGLRLETNIHTFIRALLPQATYEIMPVSNI